MIVLHNRQFILSKRVHLIDETWNSLHLKNGYILSYQNNLHFVCNRDNSVLLIGDAWQVDKGLQSPKEYIESFESFDDSKTSHIDQHESSWNGRYLLITGNYISLDAVGSYGVYFSKDNISSSLPLLCKIENRQITYPDTKWGNFPDFVPGPYTPVKGIKRVMPSQRYDYATRVFSYRKFLCPTIKDTSVTHLEKELGIMFETSLTNMYSHFVKKNIWLALTGGKDSRTAMAFLNKTKIPFNVFTFTFSDSSKEDSKIANFLSLLVGKKHHSIILDKSKYSSAIYEQYKSHTMLMNTDGESIQFPYRLYEDLCSLAKKEFLLLRNNAWESIMDYYSAYFDKPQEMFVALRANGKYDKSIDEWLKWVAEDPVNTDLSIWDRVYWEQREGCWLSAIEQSLELEETMTSVQMCNCRKILTYLHTFPYETRRHKKENLDLICMAESKLIYVPFNGELHLDESILKAYFRKRHAKIWNIFRRFAKAIRVN